MMRAGSAVRLASLGLTWTVAAVLAVAFAPSAHAAPKGVVGYFGNQPGSSPSLVAQSALVANPFSAIQSVAVNASGAGPADAGDLYVVDQGNQRIQRYSADGEFRLAWGKDVVRLGAEISVDAGQGPERCVFAPDCQPGKRGSLGGEMDFPRGIAVDQATGNVYVVERHNAVGGGGARVQAFTGDGEFLWVVGKDSVINGSASDPSGVTTTQVCVVAADCKPTTIGAQGGEFALGGSNSPSGGGNGIAVSPVVNPLTGAGNVVVTDRGNQRVQELTSTGQFVKAFGWDAVTNGSPSDPASDTGFQICTVAADCKAGLAGNGNGQFGANAPNRVAIDSAGAIYSVENSTNFRVQKFSPQPGPTGLAPMPVNSAAGAGTSDSPLDVAIGGADHLFVLKAFAGPFAERRVIEIDSAGSLVETHAAATGLTGAADLAVNTATGVIYLTSGATGDGGIGVYALDASQPAPSVSLGIGATGVHSVQLHGLINPNSVSGSTGIRARYRFEYREVGAPTWISLSNNRDAGNGSATFAVTERLEGLTADTDYEARVVAYRPFSGVGDVVAPAEQFSTQAAAPDIEAAYVTGRQATAATLNTRINPNGQATSYRFEYGTTAAYGSTAPDPDGSAGGGLSTQIFSQSLAGLSPNTTYHYRVVATSANGTTSSTDQAFTTAPSSSPSPVGRAYELVSPPDKIGGTGLGTWYAGVGSHANAGLGSLEGERYASTAYYGGSLANGGFSYGADWTLGERTATGWVNKPAFNRQGGVGTGEFGKIPRMVSASDDLSVTSWGTFGSQLSIFSEQPEVWGLQLSAAQGDALREWESGRWEIVGPLAPSQQANSTAEVWSQLTPDGNFVLLAGQLRGVAGPSDPTHSAFIGGPSDLICDASVCNRSVYVDDVSAGLSDSFPGEGVRSLVNVCTGADATRTKIPSVDSDGRIVAGPCPDALPGRSARLISQRGASAVIAPTAMAPNHISRDGSRVFFMSPDHRNDDNWVACAGQGPVSTKCPPQVYVRQRDDDGTVTTRWISKSAVADQDASLMSAAVFEGATPDGDKVFLRTASPLTVDDPNAGSRLPNGVKTGVANAGSVDLFMYDFPDSPGADPGDGTLTRVSAGPTGEGDANVSTDPVDGNTSALRGLSLDGSRIYFVTAAPLAGVPAPTSGTITLPSGTRSQSATRNLYAYDAALPTQERWRFVAQLPASSVLGACAVNGVMSSSAFMGGNNGPGLNGLVMLSTPGSSCVDVSDDGSFITFFTDGRLTADDPDDSSGDVYAYDATSNELHRVSASQGGILDSSYGCLTEGAGAGARCHGDLGVGTIAHQMTMNRIPESDGARTVYFESASRLVPQDENDVYDVYQWRDGGLSLLSTGASDAEPALYRGNDRRGLNVYISTRDRWTWQDHDQVLDVYTARIDGGVPEPATPPVCDLLLDSCQGSATPPLALPGSETTTAPGADSDLVRARHSLSIAGLTPGARRKAARTGLLRISVGANRPGLITAVAKARIAKRNRQVARASVTLGQPGTATLRLRLTRAARRLLGDGQPLRVTLRVTSQGARPRSMTLRLPGSKS